MSPLTNSIAVDNEFRQSCARYLVIPRYEQSDQQNVIFLVTLLIAMCSKQLPFRQDDLTVFSIMSKRTTIGWKWYVVARPLIHLKVKFNPLN